MAFTKSDKLKQVIFQEEIDGVLTDLWPAPTLTT